MLRDVSYLLSRLRTDSEDPWVICFQLAVGWFYELSDVSMLEVIAGCHGLQALRRPDGGVMPFTEFVRRYAEDEVLDGEPVDAVSMQMMYFLSDWVLGVPVAQLSVLRALGFMVHEV